MEIPSKRNEMVLNNTAVLPGLGAGTEKSVDKVFYYKIRTGIGRNNIGSN